MREILFSGKRKDNAEWVEGYYLKINDVSFILPNGLYLKDIVEVDPKTVCQYTGLTDKNGKKIFEGDIVRNFFCIDDHNEPLYECGKVMYDMEEGSGFMIRDEENNLYEIKMFGNIEVIGNIFDNPDLIGEEP